MGASISPRQLDIDLGGQFVSPGLIDAHLHLQMSGESLLHVDLSGVTGPEEFAARLGEAHHQMEPGRWLLASGWSENRWDPPVLPDQSWLRSCGDRPVVCWRMDHHAALVNDVVLQQLSLTLLFYSKVQHLLQNLGSQT